MASAERLRDLLPSLWRPEPEAAADDLLAGLLRAGGRVIDTASVEAGDLMQSHWFRFADSALLSPYVARFRTKAGQKPLLPFDPDVDLHPYLDDLARLGGLLGLTPWTHPLESRETVEDFRRRIARMVALWKDGLGTKAALRAATLASLPVVDHTAPPGLRERGFTVEERAPAAPVTLMAKPRGVPAELVGPLMRWRIDSGAVAATAPEIYIEGQAAGSRRGRRDRAAGDRAVRSLRSASASASALRAPSRPARHWRCCLPSYPGWASKGGC